MADIQGIYNEHFNFVDKYKTIFDNEDATANVVAGIEALKKGAANLQGNGDNATNTEIKWCFMVGRVHDLATQVLYTALREGTMTDEMLAEYRALTSGKEIEEISQDLLKDFMAEEKELSERNKVFNETRIDFGIFQNVINGKVASFDEAKKQLEAQKEKGQIA